MAGINSLLGKLMSNGAAAGLAGGVAGGLATGLMSKKTKKTIGKTVLYGGGIAAIGALAYGAYNKYNNNQVGAEQGAEPATNPNAAQSEPMALQAAPVNSAFLPAVDNQQANDALALTLVRAMIAASRADGVMDMKESQAIFGKIEELGLDSEDQALLIQEMNQTIDMDSIVKSATSPEVAAEIYTASLLAIDVDSAAEKGYLAMLAARLQLPPPLVVEIEQMVASQQSMA